MALLLTDGSEITKPKKMGMRMEKCLFGQQELDVPEVMMEDVRLFNIILYSTFCILYYLCWQFCLLSNFRLCVCISVQLFTIVVLYFYVNQYCIIGAIYVYKCTFFFCWCYDVYLVVRRTRLSTYGDRAFPVAASRVWNSLPHHGHCQFSALVWRLISSAVVFLDNITVVSAKWHLSFWTH